jgi:hypothetical protein
MMDLSRPWRILGIEIDEWLSFIPAGTGKSGSKQILHFVKDFACGLGSPRSGSTC